MKILLNYDGTSVTEPDGAFTYAWTGLEKYEFKEEDYKNQVDIVKLAGLGYSAEDIIKMKASGVI